MAIAFAYERYREGESMDHCFASGNHFLFAFTYVLSFSRILRDKGENVAA